MTDAEFQELMRRMLDGEDVDASAIEEALKEDESRLKAYLEQVEMDAMLGWELGTDQLEALENLDLGEDASPGWRTQLWAFTTTPLAKVAAVLVLLGFGFLIGQHRPNRAPVALTPVAVLIDSEDCVWEPNPVTPPSFGASFGAGETLRIESGIARLALWSKAGVAIAGPAEVELVSNDEVLVRYGDVSAFAPDEAIGFKLSTPDVEIVDLGTSFAASVAPNGTTDVHVFEGEISVQSRASRDLEELITTGQARRYGAGGAERTEIAIAPEQFVEPPALEQLLAIASPGREAAMTKSRAEVPSAPGILAAQRFTGSHGELDGRYGGKGFAKDPWWASPTFTRLIPRVESHSGGSSAGGYLLVRGRDKAEPFVANRMCRKLSEPLPDTFYFALRASYHGLDEDDFFSLWIDTNGNEGATHANVPTLGIREGSYFARLDVEHDAVAGVSQDGEEFTIAGRYVWNEAQQREEIALWIQAAGAQEDAPDAYLQGPVLQSAPGKFRYLGLRIGKYTEVSDRLLIHGLVVSTSLDSALTAVQP